MNVYLFRYTLKPTKLSEHYGKIGGAHADLWAYDKDIDTARIKVQSYIMDYGWSLVEVEAEHVMPEEQILHLGIDAQSNFHAAKQWGISAFFSAYPVQDRADNVVEIHTLEKPHTKTSNKKH